MHKSFIYIFAFLAASSLSFTDCRITTVPGLLAESDKIELLHTPANEKDLPLPGDMIELKVITQGSRNVDLPIRLIAIIDNKLVDLTMPSATITQDEKTVYSALLPAPVEKLQYQFIGFDKSKKPITSKWFILSRQCKYDTSETTVDLQRMQNSDQVAELYNLSAKLERELKAYKNSQTLLESILTFRKNQAAQ